MPRSRRRVHAGESYHVFDRGNNKQRIFLDETDYRIFLLKAFKAAEKHKVLVHSYALMPNHFHFFVTATSQKCVSTFMRALKGGYGQWFNKIYKRTGTLWETRFNAVLVDSVRYALVIYRYIELNPVKGGLVKRPTLWSWSSVHFNARGIEQPGLTPHPVYSLLGDTPAARQAAYRRFVVEAGGRSRSMYEAQCKLIEEAQSRLSVLGDDAFLSLAIARDKQNYQGILQLAYNLFPDLLDGLPGIDALRTAMESSKGQALVDLHGRPLVVPDGPLKGQALSSPDGAPLRAKRRRVRRDVCEADLGSGAEPGSEAEAEAAAAAAAPKEAPEHLLNALRIMVGLVRGWE